MQIEGPIQWPTNGWRGSAAARKRRAVRATVVLIAIELYAEIDPQITQMGRRFFLSALICVICG